MKTITDYNKIPQRDFVYQSSDRQKSWFRIRLQLIHYSREYGPLNGQLWKLLNSMMYWEK